MSDKPYPRTLLREADRLFGPRVAADVLAAMLGINRRTVQRWFSGENPFPRQWAPQVGEILDLARRNHEQAAQDRAARREP